MPYFLARDIDDDYWRPKQSLLDKGRGCPKSSSSIYTVLRAWRSLAVTRSLFLRLLLRDHAQTATLWKTVAVHLKLLFLNVFLKCN